MIREKQLLPVGFYDLLFEEAEKNHENINSALAMFLKASYRLIKTPLVEFEDNFHSAEIANSFRSVDVISGKDLIFRNDITPQISRLLASRLKNEKLPLKLCYVGDVLCKKNNDLYADRQQTQVGAEIIGCDLEESNYEIIEILLSVLKKLTDKNLLIEFSLPNFLEVFLNEIGEKNNAELIAAIKQKNISLIKKFANKNAEIITKIALSNQNLKNLALEIFGKINSQKITFEINRAQKIAEFLQKNFPQIKVCFDLFGDDKTSYHRDIAFDVFADNFSYAIARGGRYKINDLDAIGATIYMNFLRKI
ncbi:MAG: ATP phosphoribosyltransferase regulatory subunit [Rickettsiales bacterium]|nr:ATP phosphoribosyltransferase regulatory subunit [Rickettsiales bacterium]